MLDAINSGVPHRCHMKDQSMNRKKFFCVGYKNFIAAEKPPWIFESVGELLKHHFHPSMGKEKGSESSPSQNPELKIQN